MKASKVTVTIKMESLDIATLGSMLNRVIQEVENEAETGELYIGDGDSISWKTTREHVTF